MPAASLVSSLPPAVLLKQARLLATRLERLTPDSIFAHRASGCRRSLLRLSDELEERLEEGILLEDQEIAALRCAVEAGFAIIEEAASKK